MRSPLTMSPPRQTQSAPAEHPVVERAQTGLGAYGVALAGLDDAARLLRPAEPWWPSLQVEIVELDTPRPIARERLTDHDAQYRLTAGGSMTVERDSGRCTLAFPPGERAPSASDLVHPYLTTPLATVRHWAGSSVLHAGAFVAGGAAWVVPGTKGAGKSTLLAALAMLGADVLADDLAVIDGADVLAGPACIDLRSDAAAWLDVGDDIGVVGHRRRWRYELPPVPTRVPLGGVLALQWDQHAALQPLRVDDRLRMLLTNVALRPAPPAPDVLLALASMPGYTFARPRDWPSITTSAERLLEVLGG
jgi:hypothetical protein